MRIVVGLDTAPSSALALRWAAEHARAGRHTLVAVHAVLWRDQEKILLPTGLTTLHAVGEHEQPPAMPAEVRAAFASVDPEPSWTLTGVVGDPGPVLVDQSAEADLLVIGTGEHGLLGRLLAGSVSHYCLGHAHCPVVAVPVGWRAPAETASPGAMGSRPRVGS